MVQVEDKVSSSKPTVALDDPVGLDLSDDGAAKLKR